jgi:hypothetical protein
MMIGNWPLMCFILDLVLHCNQFFGSYEGVSKSFRTGSNNNNKHSLRSNTKGYGGKIHYIDPQNSDTTAPSGKELYHLQFSLQVASLETFGYTLVCRDVTSNLPFTAVIVGCWKYSAVMKYKTIIGMRAVCPFCWFVDDGMWCKVASLVLRLYVYSSNINENALVCTFLLTM